MQNRAGLNATMRDWRPSRSAATFNVMHTKRTKAQILRHSFGTYHLSRVALRCSGVPFRFCVRSTGKACIKEGQAQPEARKLRAKTNEIRALPWKKAKQSAKSCAPRATKINSPVPLLSKRLALETGVQIDERCRSQPWLMSKKAGQT